MAETRLIPRMLDKCHELLAEHITSGHFAIDATAGNGHDTAFIANLVGKTGRVWAFDIQKAAIESTEKRLDSLGLQNQVTLILGSHSQMNSYVPSEFTGRISGIVFNLGYLPGSDKVVTTRVPTSIEAVNQSLSLLSPDGILTVSIYPGHEEGYREGQALLDGIPEIENAGWLVYVYKVPEPKSPAPFLITYERKKS